MIINATINLAVAGTVYQLYERLQSVGALRTDANARQLQELLLHVLKLKVAPAAAAGTKFRLVASGATDFSGPSADAGIEYGNEAAGGTGAAATPVLASEFHLKVDGNRISLTEIYLETQGTNVEVQVFGISI